MALEKAVNKNVSCIYVKKTSDVVRQRTLLKYWKNNVSVGKCRNLFYLFVYIGVLNPL